MAQLNNSIRIDTGAKKIEVNDDGEFIILPLGDQSFPKRFFDLIDSFEESEKEFRERLKSVMDIQDVDKQTREGISLNLEFHERFKNQVDELFGKETCRKVFGDIVAPIQCYADFFQAIVPFFEQHSKNRQKKFSAKYNHKRVGNV